MNARSGANRNIYEATVGYWYRLHRGEYGRIEQGNQVVYIHRNLWCGIGSTPQGSDVVVYTSLRFYFAVAKPVPTSETSCGILGRSELHLHVPDIRKFYRSDFVVQSWSTNRFHGLMKPLLGATLIRSVYSRTISKPRCCASRRRASA